ncbi:RNA-binding protein 33-like isoform X2 [Rana temporaria]|uniref:RNA-binding protein 33-like isoform X2 n=1 Tax=Rana temporaria TaxID=8407 RepID=UPI001AAD646D|nr:RNA-binding protein 33-like isoform X2 [Rana temporaria]
MMTLPGTESLTQKGLGRRPTDDDWDSTQGVTVSQDMEAGAEDFVGSYEDNSKVPDEQIEYQDDDTIDYVSDLEITEPLDEFQEEDVSQASKRQKMSNEQYVEDVVEEAEEAPDEAEEQQGSANNTEEAFIESQEFPPDIKEESDEDEEGGGRIRFKTERKKGTIIRLSDFRSERRNIPDTLDAEISLGC